MRSARRAAGCLLLAGTAIACSADDGQLAEPQCRLLDRPAVEEATGRTAQEGVVFEHEESGDGTWCLYEVAGDRVELQFRSGDRAEFDSLRDAARREGAVFADLDGVGDAAFFATNGINNTTVLVTGHLLVVQSLDAVGDEAKELTSQLARAGADNCCPS